MDIEQLELQKLWCETPYECKAIVAVAGHALGVMARTADGRNIVTDSKSRIFIEHSDDDVQEWELSPLYDNPADAKPTFRSFRQRCEAWSKQAQAPLCAETWNSTQTLGTLAH